MSEGDFIFWLTIFIWSEALMIYEILENNWPKKLILFLTFAAFIGTTLGTILYRYPKVYLFIPGFFGVCLFGYLILYVFFAFLKAINHSDNSILNS